MNLHDVSKVILPDHADLNILLIDDAPRLVVVQSNEERERERDCHGS